MPKRQCRRDNQKQCIPIPIVWAKTRCHHCIMHDYSCSQNSVDRDGSIHFQQVSLTDEKEATAPQPSAKWKFSMFPGRLSSDWLPKYQTVEPRSTQFGLAVECSSNLHRREQPQMATPWLEPSRDLETTTWVLSESPETYESVLIGGTPDGKNLSKIPNIDKVAGSKGLSGFGPLEKSPKTVLFRSLIEQGWCSQYPTSQPNWYSHLGVDDTIESFPQLSDCLDALSKTMGVVSYRLLRQRLEAVRITRTMEASTEARANIIGRMLNEQPEHKRNELEQHIRIGRRWLDLVNEFGSQEILLLGWCSIQARRSVLTPDEFEDLGWIDLDHIDISLIVEEGNDEAFEIFKRILLHPWFQVRDTCSRLDGLCDLIHQFMQRTSQSERSLSEIQEESLKTICGNRLSTTIGFDKDGLSIAADIVHRIRSTFSATRCWCDVCPSSVGS
ncbi:uncharacterized protein CTRU02_210687 [Colletotrichum truncatum]|uniref:Uncharacterized protein n=1 Tax=Colletotrichum truncatum TaxID=5467 RepID=A0ACC3YPU0_COLTU|nr:uncharacterized protein CTRU02_03820 [Colletotrichum truncatum]KAF6796842.1 hypothetical protein CTRU02_03820 [Colletotrichum truncatum]